jgi:hypothetical protein
MEAKEKLEVAGGGASEGLAVPLFVSSYIGDHIGTLVRIKETLLATLYSVRRLRSRYVRFKSVYKRSTSSQEARTDEERGPAMIRNKQYLDYQTDDGRNNEKH